MLFYRRNCLASAFQANTTLNTWWYEMLCGVVISACFAALIAVASHYDNNTIPQLPYGLSLNAVVAIFAVTIKTSLALVLSEGISHLKWISLEETQTLKTFDLFDQASRGPWGALYLITNTGWKPKYIIAALGALTTLLLLPLDPLAQQIVQYRNCQRIRLGSSATVRRAQVFDVGMLSHINAGEAPFELIIGHGLFNEAPPQVEYSCDTGNCSFVQTVNTLGFCGSCTDVSHLIVQTAKVSGNFLNEITQSQPFDMSINWTLPAGLGTARRDLSLTWRYTIKPWESSPPTLDSSVLGGPIISLGGTNFDMSTQIKWSNLSMVWLLKDGIPWDKLSDFSGDPSALMESLSAKAITCNIRPCVRSFNTSIQDNRLLEFDLDLENGSRPAPNVFEDVPLLLEEEDHWSKTQYESQYNGHSSIADLECLDDKERRFQILRDLGYRFEDSQRWLPYKTTLVLPPEDGFIGYPFLRELEDGWIVPATPTEDISSQAKKLYVPFEPDPNLTFGFEEYSMGSNYSMLNPEARAIVPMECIYYMNREAMRELSSTLRIVLEMGNGENYSYMDPLLYSRMLSLGITENAKSGFEGVEKGFSKMIDRIAQALTTAVRNASHDLNKPLNGTVFENTTCVTIQWAWVSYIILLVALYSVFLAATILKSRFTQAHLNADAMSTSNVKHNFHNFKSSSIPVVLQGSASNRTSLLEKKAEKVHLRVIVAEHGWQILFEDLDAEGSPESQQIHLEAHTLYNSDVPHASDDLSSLME